MSFPIDMDDFDDKSYTGGRSEPTSRSHRDTQMPDTSEDLESLLQGLRQNRPGREDASAANLNQSTSSYSSGSSTRDSDLVSLQRIWIAERTAPEILPFDEALIDRIMGRLREQIRYIEETSMSIQVGNDNQLKVLLVETELERVKYLLRGYLRTRLSKIDKYTLFLLAEEREQKKLAVDEIKYMKAHNEIISRLFRNQFLAQVPTHLQDLDASSMVVSPDLDKAVFVRVIAQDIELSLRVGGDIVTLEPNGIYALRYSSISKYLQSGVVELV